MTRAASIEGRQEARGEGPAAGRGARAGVRAGLAGLAVMGAMLVGATSASAITIAPAIAVTNTPSPASRPAPGGTFTFTVQVSNPSATTSTKITGLVDDTYGDLSVGQGTCGALINTTLAPMGSSSCSFAGSFAGSPGASQTDTVTATGTVVGTTTTTTATGAATVTLTKFVAGISTQVSSAFVGFGGAFNDTATLTAPAGVQTLPTGTVTFNVYGPVSGGTCAPLASSSNNAVDGSGRATSSTFTPTIAGTYLVIASYGGDANYAPASGACGDPNESVAVSARSVPSLSTRASLAAVNSNFLSDTATLSGGFVPTGTITFRLYGPSNTTCGGAQIATSTRTVTGNGTYVSDTSAVFSPGSYTYIASYSGDNNNQPVTGVCTDPNETVFTNPPPAPVAPSPPTAPVTPPAGPKPPVPGPTPPAPPAAKKVICAKVPSLLRHSFRGALKILARSGCGGVKLTHTGHARRPPSHVKAQSVPAGSVLRAGDTLGVKLG